MFLPKKTDDFSEVFFIALKIVFVSVLTWVASSLIGYVHGAGPKRLDACRF
jgi:hypothetical protein